MKNLITVLVALFLMSSCAKSDESESQVYDAPFAKSYVTYISQNSVTLNGFVDLTDRAFINLDTYNTSFIFRSGNENDSSNDEIFNLQGEVEYYTGTYKFNYSVNNLEPNTTYYYTALTQNGSTQSVDWKSFTTSEVACAFSQNNSYTLAGTPYSANVEVSNPNCCSEGNIRFRFGNWPNILEISFYELNQGYPKTGQYFGVENEFDISYIQREITKSTNLVLIGNNSSEQTELFVENDGETITLIFCNTVLANGDIINGKVSAVIP